MRRAALTAFRLRMSLTEARLQVNGVLTMDLVYLHVRPLLHVGDSDSRFQDKDAVRYVGPGTVLPVCRDSGRNVGKGYH